MSTKVLLREAPWCIGVVVGLIGMWWRGYAFVPLPFLSSYDWMEYIPSAWMVANGMDVGGYATWRNPLYPAILGQMGEWVGYNEATWILSSLFMSAVVFASGLGARALSTPAAGMVAAITIPHINPWAEASRWSTLYPMLTACTAAALAFGACFIRWGHPIYGAIAGLAAGLALGIDFRGIALVVAVAVMAAFALARRRQKASAALVIACLLVGPLLNRSVAVSHQKQTATAVQTQRALEVQLAIDSGNMDLVRACRDEPVDGAYPTFGTLLRPCAWAFVRDNLSRFKDQAPFGVTFTLLLLPLTLVPGRRGWSASVNSLLVFGASFGAMFLMAIWARLNVHHFVQFAAPVAMVVPVAVARLVETVSTSTIRTALSGALTLAGIGWITTAGPWAGKPVDDLATAEQNQLLGWMINGVNMHFDAASGDQLLDCSGLGVEAALLPRRLNDGLPNFQNSATAQRCQEWIQAPKSTSGRQWLITRQEPEFTGPPRPPWVQVEAWVDGPRRTWLWMRVDSPRTQP